MATIKVLLMTISEHGQANIFLALACELLCRGNVEVHLCSYAPLQPRFEELLDKYGHSFQADYRSRARFHTMRGPSMIEVSSRGGSGGPLPHPPTVTGCIDSFKALDGDVWSWTKEEFLEGYQSGKEIIDTVTPNITVIDQYFLLARDAAVNTGIKYCLIESMALSRVVGRLQKHQAWLWKYPVAGTSFSFPVPWYNIPQNSCLQPCLAYAYMTSTQRKKVLRWREEAGIKGPFPWEDEWKVDRLTPTPSLPDLDWPLEVPDNVIGCGPILLPTDERALAESDIYQWMQRGPTVLINLGSLYIINAAGAENIALAIDAFLNTASIKNVQILWKLGSYRSHNERILSTGHEILGELISECRVKVVRWLDVDPAALLSTGHIACSVHHGGANSWFEALRHGAPQILLPAWYDCYDDAKRTEVLGVGVWANKVSAPAIDADALAESLHAIFDVGKYQAKATDMAHKLGAVNGRALAADEILKAASPDHFVWGRMPSETPRLEHIHNRDGKILTSIKADQREDNWLDRAFQTFCIMVHITFPIWSLLLCGTLLCAPLILGAVELLPGRAIGGLVPLSAERWKISMTAWVLWLAYAAWSTILSSASEESTVPLRYRLAQSTPIWRAYCRARAAYFPITLWKSCDIPPTRSYIIGYHPHGSTAIGINVLDHHKLGPGTKLFFTVNDVALKLPVMTDVAQMLDAKSVSAAGVRAQLTTGGNDGRGAGNLIAISIGGGKEASYTRPHSMDIVCRCRKGFVKQAFEAGAYITPMISFGENELMDLVGDDAGWIAWMMKKLFTILFKTERQKDFKLYKGLWGLPFFAPYRKPINLVLGHPIPVIRQSEPSAEYITEVHERYMRELEQLWNDWREAFGIERSVEFRIVE